MPGIEVVRWGSDDTQEGSGISRGRPQAGITSEGCTERGTLVLWIQYNMDGSTLSQVQRYFITEMEN